MIDEAALLADLSSADLHIRDKALCDLSKLEDVPASVKDPLLRMLDPGEHWALRLHLVRVLPHVKWSTEEEAEVMEYLFTQAEGKNKFVKAWAVDSLASMAVENASIRDRVGDILLKAFQEGSAAVRVRAREGMARLARASQ